MSLPDMDPYFQLNVLDLQALPSHPHVSHLPKCGQPLMEAEMSLAIRLLVASLQKEYESESLLGAKYAPVSP